MYLLRGWRPPGAAGPIAAKAGDHKDRCQDDRPGCQDHLNSQSLVSRYVLDMTQTQSACHAHRSATAERTGRRFPTACTGE